MADIAKGLFNGLIGNYLIYFFNMLSYVLVGLLGTNAVFAAAAFYVIIFFAASVLFLSRKA